MKTQRDPKVEIGLHEPVPASFAPCFQEFEVADLDILADRDLIIERLLAFGNRDEVRWLIEQYGQSYVSDWVRGDASRRLPRSRRQLWLVVISGNDVPPSAPDPRAAIWPH